MNDNRNIIRISGTTLVPAISIDYGSFTPTSGDGPLVAPGTPIMPDGFITETGPNWDQPLPVASPGR